MLSCLVQLPLQIQLSFQNMWRVQSLHWRAFCNRVEGGALRVDAAVRRLT